MKSEEGEDLFPPGMSMDESMRHCLVYFEDALRSLAGSPRDIYQDFGCIPEASWEVLQEVISGKPLIKWGKLPREKRKKIDEIVTVAENMPAHAYPGVGMEDFLDPAWRVLKDKSLAYFGD